MTECERHLDTLRDLLASAENQFRLASLELIHRRSTNQYRVSSTRRAVEALMFAIGELGGINAVQKPSAESLPGEAQAGDGEAVGGGDVGDRGDATAGAGERDPA